jgi:hypothetical protein
MPRICNRHATKRRLFTLVSIAALTIGVTVAVSPQTPAAGVEIAPAVSNSSFESGWTSTTPATCWALGGVGTGTGTVAASTTAHSGRYAAKLTVSSLASSANRKLVIDQRTPGCAPSVIPGHRYGVSAWYRASAAPRFSVYYHNASGWHYWTQSSTFATRSSWGAMEFETDYVPSGSDGLSFGPSLISVGWVLVDDAAIVDRSAVGPTPSPTPKISTSSSPAPSTSTSRSPENIMSVSTAAQLSGALAAAVPGQTVRLADGTYVGNFTLNRSGTATAPIRVTGSRGAIIDGGSVSGGYALHLDNANYVQVDGIRISNAQKAIVLDQSSHVTLTNLDLHFTGNEILLIRNYSSDNVVSNNQIHDAGRTNAGYGEGVYVGLSKSNWSSAGQSRTGGGPDSSDRNEILGNNIYNTTAESVDIKEGTTGGLIANNTFDSIGMSGANYADSWVDIAGNGYLVQGNIGTNPGSALRDGYQTHVILSGWANSNQFRANTSSVNADGYGINVQMPSSGNVVFSDNTVSAAGKGLTDIAVTSG